MYFHSINYCSISSIIEFCYQLSKKILNREIKKALQIAKEFFVYDLSPILTFIMVRCELVNKNYESAYQCIKKFIEEDEDHFMIYFFYA